MNTYNAIDNTTAQTGSATPQTGEIFLLGLAVADKSLGNETPDGISDPPPDPPK